MNTRLVVVSLLFAAPSLLPQQSNELVLNQPPFAVYSAFWPNLHHVLWAEAWARRPPSEETAAGTLPEPLTAELTAQERRAWDAAVSYYDEEVADLHPLFEMRSIRKAMIAAGPELPETGLEPAHREALLAAAAVYRKYWWPAHDAANRAWLVDPMSKVASLTPAVPERLSRLYGVPWFTSGVRVDVVRVGTREGAFASIDPAPAHITLSSSAPALREWMAAEILFHESSHALAFPLMDDFAAELRMQRKASWHLWHVALFYLTGEVVRQTLAERGIPYEPYMYKTGLLERAWPEFRAPIETYWKPYVNGEVSRDDAIRHVVRASKGIQMSSANYFTDVMVRWRLWDAAAILAIALWTAFAARPASNGSTVVVVLLVAACLALSVRMLPHAAANVFLHALAVASSLMATRVVVSRLARSRFLRIVLAVIAAPLGYAAGRGLAMVSIWLVTGNAL